MTWRYELKYEGQVTWETGYDSYDDACNAMSESMSEILDKESEKNPGLSDEEIERKIEWEVLEE